MAQFNIEEELSFVKELPEHVKIECPVCLNILTDPHLVSCCGHNFCGSCIERVKASNGSCPMCKEKEYQAMVNKGLLRIINGLEVYCSNKEKGCEWKGELKNMSTHLNKEKREGECQYEEVKCRYENCQERMQRRYLEDHEDRECPQRPFQCQYCRRKGTFLSITKDHYEECRQYPVTCPNKCSSTNMPRGSLTAHINECPLEPVDCVFSWAGCNDKPLRKDVHVHVQAAAIEHMTLLAVACGQLKKENEQLKVLEGEVGKLKQEVGTLKTENAILKDHVHNAVVAEDSYPLLPVDVKSGRPAVHFYTSTCGRHMSAKLMRGSRSTFAILDDGAKNEILIHENYILLAFHQGKFKRQFPKIFAKYKGEDIPLLVDTEATYEQSPTNILDSIQWEGTDTTVPIGVIDIKLGEHALRDDNGYAVTIYANSCYQ